MRMLRRVCAELLFKCRMHRERDIQLHYRDTRRLEFPIYLRDTRRIDLYSNILLALIDIYLSNQLSYSFCICR